MLLWNEVDFKTLFSTPERRKSKKNGKNYISLIGAFDIETSTVNIENEGNIAFMYIWQMAINDIAFYGRTWEELRMCLEKIRKDLILTFTYKMRVYVHNQKFDFSFFKSEIQVTSKDFYARDKHDVIQCVVDNVFEFRDSYCYTEKSLEDMGKECGILKLDGYDYKKIRTSTTPLTPEELSYCENDVKILTKYFRNELIKYKSIADIPLTATQKVKKILWKNYRDMGSKAATLALKLKENRRDRATLQLLKSAYWGAYNFYNPIHTYSPLNDVISSDLDSAYASLALRKKFPMYKFQAMPIPKSINSLLNDKNYCYLITLKIKELKNLYPFVGYLPTSKSKHWQINTDEMEVEQGKILYTKCAIITITEIDLKIMCELYKPEKIEILSVLRSKKAYLPQYITYSIIEVYQAKKKLKREQQEIKKHRELTDYEKQEYLNVKSMVSRIYGVFVQDPEPIQYKYDEDNNDVDADGKMSIKTASELTNYAWGVWITAYCRYEMINLLKKIAVDSSHGKEKYKNNVVYIDTDCIKYRDNPNVTSIVAQYNQNVKEYFKKFSSLHNIRFSDIEGIGELDIEKYQTFKVLGLKQYVFINDSDKFIYKISGLSKKNELFDGRSPMECMEIVKSEMYLPADIAHNSKCRYVTYNEHKTFTVTDYLSQVSEVSIKSFAVIEEEGFKMDASDSNILENVNPDKTIKKLRRG